MELAGIWDLCHDSLFCNPSILKIPSFRIYQIVRAMDYLPIFVKAKDRKCILIGGQELAFNKLLTILKTESTITVIAPSLCPKMMELLEIKQITYRLGPFSEDDLNICDLVFVATEDEELKLRVAEAANRRRIPVNVIDRPELSSFIMPSLIDRSPLLVAISTSGASPTLGRLIRSRIESMLPQPYGRLAKLIGSFRERSKMLYKDPMEHRKFWDRIFSSSVIETFLSGKESAAKKALEKEFDKEKKNPKKNGLVCLIGAGPGDPDLLTLKAMRIIQNADAIVYDRLVSPVILEYARREAEKIYVGKKKSVHTVSQDRINQVLVDLAKEGKLVVRLKGGDPFIFGRGGEELEKLIRHNVEFQVIPGITSASGCGSYAGIPLTHRDYAQSCILVTGHSKEGALNLNWSSLIQPHQTLVFYMGLSNIDILCEKLVTHGMAADMPAAVVQKGTTINQKVFTGTVSNLPIITAENHVTPPILIIFGEVVKLHNKLAWFNAGDPREITSDVLFDE